MARYEVTVMAEWQSQATFEFDSAREAEQFRDTVNNSNGTHALQAIEDNDSNELDTSNAELVGWNARRVRES